MHGKGAPEPDTYSSAARTTGKYVPRFLRNPGAPEPDTYSSAARTTGKYVPSFRRNPGAPEPDTYSSAARTTGKYVSRFLRNPGRANPDPKTPQVISADEIGNLRISESSGPANGDQNGIDFDAYDDIPVETSGSDVPPPADSFSDIDLGEALNRNIQRCRYSKPTPVQRYAIPILLAGRDLMASAQTGSGKTAAFCFPIISGILKRHAPLIRNGSRRPGRSAACPLALILSPTRELSCQIFDEAKKFSYQSGLRVCVVYGGTPAFGQVRDLEKGVDVLVATPGRLMDLIERGSIWLEKAEYLVLDEADRMLDMGFEPQIRRIVEQSGMPRPGTRQTMLFSATFPHAVQRLASSFLCNYIFLTVGRVGSSSELIEQRVEYVTSDWDKRNRLKALLLQPPKDCPNHNEKTALTLVFMETKKRVDSLQSWLCRNGFPAVAIHGGRNQLEREEALRSFKGGETRTMVATDVAARGLDIPSVGHVINFDFPRNMDDYVHRIGRTGRAGRSGLATALFGHADLPLAGALAELMTESGQEPPHWLFQYATTDDGKPRFAEHDFRKDALSEAVHDFMKDAQSEAVHDHDSEASNAGYDVDTQNQFIPTGCEYDHIVPTGCEYDHIVPTGWD